MDESGCFSKALPDKGLVEKGRGAKGGKKVQIKIHHSFFINAAGEKIDEPVVIWNSKKPSCFKRLSAKSRPADGQYFSNPKSWMAFDVIQLSDKLFCKSKTENFTDRMSGSKGDSDWKSEPECESEPELEPDSSPYQFFPSK